MGRRGGKMPPSVWTLNAQRLGNLRKGLALKSMCNDYERHGDWRAFCKALEDAKLSLAADAHPSQLSTSDDTRVNDLAPVIRSAGNGVELAMLKWGFRSKRPGGPPVFNFRSEGRSFAASKGAVSLIATRLRLAGL